MLATPVSIVNSWMRSQGHRDNILNANFEEIGVGIVPGSPKGGLLDGSATYATEFGWREVAGRASPTRVSAASLAVDVTPPAAKRSSAKAKKLSAKTRRRISRQCHRVARRTKASAKTRRARYDRCVKSRTRAARTSAR